MKLLDNTVQPLRGYVKVERSINGGPWIDEGEGRNLVLNSSSLILRNLMFGDDSERISKIVFGDMFLTEADDLRNVESPEPTDVDLKNRLFEKAVTQELANYEGHPAIIYTTTLNQEEFNGTGEQLITEYGLANNTNKLFTRKTRAAIYKDQESSLRFTWTLVFQ